MGSNDVVLLASASRDLDDGEKFYDDKQKGLGQYFLQSLFADLESLKIYAGIHVTTEKTNLHMMRAKRFPYLIYYRMIDKVAYVVAVLPTRRSSSWASQLLSQRSTN